MATAETRTPRLLAAAKEFNIGKSTLVEFLTKKGFSITDSPAFKLSEEMYNALQAEYAQDKAARLKSEEIALPKGVSADSKKHREEAEFVARAKKIEESAAALAAMPVEVKKSTVDSSAAGQNISGLDAGVPSGINSTKDENKPEAIAAANDSVKEGTGEEEVASNQAISDGKPETALDAPQERDIQDAPASLDEPNQHIEIKAPKLGGPNVLGKINLDALNQSSRPKKGATKKTSPANASSTTKPVQKQKNEPSDEVKSASKSTPTVSHPAEPVKIESELTVQATTDPVTSPKPEQTVLKPQDIATAKPVADIQVVPAQEDDKPEHIEMKAPKLEGPKIIGKIDLSTTETKSDNKEKRNRKRIPVNKRPESHSQPSSNQNNNNNQAQNRHGGGHQHGGNQQGNRDRRAASGQSGDRNRGGQQRGHSNTPAQPQEIDQKAIQDKIRQTQAKLAGNTRGKGQKSKYRRDKRDLAAERRAAEMDQQNRVIQVTEFISVSELASLLDVSFADVISKCMGLGIMVSINQRLDAEVIELVANEFGYEVSFINLEQETVEDEDVTDNEEDLLPRAPIVTIMGHVDHGKTSLLDYIRNANVVAGEAGGITQHIGAYQVTTGDSRKITFLDTPGHEAFTAMRARGAKVADIAVIVIAADDAIMPQTKEAISHAQAAGLPMIFALNKIDKEGANPEKIKEQLANMNILVEDWGGKFQSQEISAKKGLHVDLLLEKILLEAELLDLKANPDRSGIGSVIEASLDKGRGYQSTVLVQNGTLNQGDMIVCGQYFGKIKAMFNERGQRVTTAGPSAPVQVLGLNGAPQAGEKLKVYEDEDEAKEVANHRAQILREQGIRTRKHITLDEIGRRLALGNFKELSVIIKGDFDGSVEALSDSLQKLSTEEVAVNVVHKGVGQITESDVLLATASDAIIIGFQVRPSAQASRLAEQENIEIRTYSIIYDAIEEVKSAMEGLLEPKVERKTVANVEIREVYKISGVGTIAGCYVLDGKIARGSKVNLVRDGIVVFNGELGSLKRFKDDVKEVAAGYECGLSVKNYNDIRVSDILEAYEEVSVKRTL